MSRLSRVGLSAAVFLMLSIACYFGGGRVPGAGGQAGSAVAQDTGSGGGAAARSAHGSAVADGVDRAGGQPRSAPIIGTLKGRTHTVMIHSGPRGPLFTVSSNDGKVLGRKLTADQLRAEHPELYRQYRNSVVGSGGYLDASLPLKVMVPRGVPASSGLPLEPR